MAKPIPATPTLSGADARALLDSLEKCAPPEEMARRIAAANKRLQKSPDGSVVYALRWRARQHASRHRE